MRDAIDRYKDASDKGQIQVKAGNGRISCGSGHAYQTDSADRRPDKRMRFLREIPTDPMTEKQGLGDAFGAGRPRFHIVGRTGCV